MRPLLRLWPYVWRYPGRVMVAGMALLLGSGAVLSVGQGLRAVIDQGFIAGDPQGLNLALYALLGIVTLLACAVYWRFYLVSWLGERVVADLRQEVFAHLLRLSPAYYETTRVGDLLSRLTTDTTLLQTLIGSSLSLALRNSLQLAGGTIMLLITSPRLAGLVLLLVPVVVIPILAGGRRVRRLSRRSQDEVAAVGARIEETLNAIRTVQAFGQEEAERIRFRQQVEAACTAAHRRNHVRAALTGLVIFLALGAVGMLLWLGGRDVLTGAMSAGTLSAFVIYALVVAGSVGAISEVVGDVQRAAGAAERLLELLATPPKIMAPAQPVSLPQPARGAVRFAGVRFCYPSRPQSAALDAFDLDVAPGTRVALVGPSGAGKTTVFQLLQRFYDPQSGGVFLDGVDIRAADPAAVRQRLGLVAQEPVIFAADAWTNIRYGRPEAHDAEVLAAAEAAHARAFLEQLPQGLSTFLGERGVRLSGGQKQRLAIARALLRNPPVLLLDEATSALDAESERLVQAALDQLMQNRTTLVIAHRLSTIRTADMIVVMESGRAVARGRHADLERQGGLYARLTALQTPSASPLFPSA
mgnify:CR=1 FL=1